MDTYEKFLEELADEQVELNANYELGELENLQISIKAVKLS